MPEYPICPAGHVLEAVGMAFYGENWKNRLADDLNIRERALQRWLPGHAPIPEGVWRDLLNLVDKRVADLARVRELIMSQLGEDERGDDALRLTTKNRE